MVHSIRNTTRGWTYDCRSNFKRDRFFVIDSNEIPSNDYDGTIPTITCNKNILNDEQLRLAGLELVNENVHFESPYKVRFQSYMHSQYISGLVREKGYWETL